MQVPPAIAEAAIIGPTSELVRRIEIYEADSTTKWSNGDYDDRLIEGEVSIDYTRDERRSFELTLDNDDFALEHTPSAFWYDKIIKIFCGVNYVDTSPVTSFKYRYNLALNPNVTSNTTNWAANTGTGGAVSAARITGSGSPVSDTAYEVTWTTAPTALGGGGYHYAIEDIVPGETYSASIWVRSSKAQTLYMLFYYYDAAGVSIGGAVHTGPATVVQAGVWTELKIENKVAPANAARMLTGAYCHTTGSIWAVGDKLALTGVWNGAGATATGQFTGATLDFGNRDYSWAGTPGASKSVETTTITKDNFVDAVWEVQVGEFMIDRISEDHFPHTVKVSGRDYAKKCMLSKFTTATSFPQGMAIEDAVKAMAQNAGIFKFLIPLSGRQLGKAYSFERGTSRWEAMKEVADSFGYELFFDARGYLVMRDYRDPVTAPVAYSLATGPMVGNLVTYSKTVNDSRIYNKIVVTGESSDSEVIPVAAVATNTLASSPTNIAKLGERVYQYTSAFIVTEQQAQDVANKFLSIHALEEFELQFSSIALPWLEVGEIVEFVDPRPSADQPTKFLLSSLQLPLGLGPMSGNAKRVSMVG